MRCPRLLVQLQSSASALGTLSIRLHWKLLERFYGKLHVASATDCLTCRLSQSRFVAVICASIIYKDRCALREIYTAVQQAHSVPGHMLSTQLHRYRTN